MSISLSIATIARRTFTSSRAGCPVLSAFDQVEVQVDERRRAAGCGSRSGAFQCLEQRGREVIGEIDGASLQGLDDRLVGVEQAEHDLVDGPASPTSSWVRLIRQNWPCSHSVVNGPDTTGSGTFGTRALPRRSCRPRCAPAGRGSPAFRAARRSCVFQTIVVSLGAVMLSVNGKSRCSGRRSSSMTKFAVKTKSCAVRGSPSLHLSPSRSLKVHVEPVLALSTSPRVPAPARDLPRHSRSTSRT